MKQTTQKLSLDYLVARLRAGLAANAVGEKLVLLIPEIKELIKVLDKNIAANVVNQKSGVNNLRGLEPQQIYDVMKAMRVKHNTVLMWWCAFQKSFEGEERDAKQRKIECLEKQLAELKGLAL